MSCNKIQSNRNILSKLYSLKNGKPADVSWLRHQVILLKGDFGSVLQFSVFLKRERGDNITTQRSGAGASNFGTF